MCGLSWNRILPPRPMILAPLLAIGFLTTWAAMPGAGQTGAMEGEWRTYGGDLGNTRYSKLDQINAANFNTLEVAWSFKTDSLGPHREYQYEVTPLYINGVLYATAGSRRAVVALDECSPRVVVIDDRPGRICRKDPHWGTGVNVQRERSRARRRGAATAIRPRGGLLD